MKTETILEKAQAESQEFGEYAENMLHYFPEMNMPTLRDCYKHHALPSEYRGHIERVRNQSAAAPEAP